MKIAPSILAADFTRLGEEIASAEAAGADQLHIDVMDGHFVPNLSMGPMIVQAARRVTKLPLDVHLMVTNPENFLDAFANAGSDALTIHIESRASIPQALAHIREFGIKAGIAINPDTPVSSISHVLDMIDIILVMSVNPGFGGQAFIADSVTKVQEIREMVAQGGLACEISVDGGIHAPQARELANAGATTIVAGSSVFSADVGIAAAVSNLRTAVKGLR